jgi:molybdopterin-guanine dinucleotide biosynthesis protein A
LGVVLAGGLSSRFGSDKALAQLCGQPLLSHAIDTLGQWCDVVVVAGRHTAPAPTIADWPRPGMGPLAGLAAALRLARAEGYRAVLSCGVDVAGLPQDLVCRLAPAPAYVESQPVIGLWPANAADAAMYILNGSGRHSLRALAGAINARPVTLPFPPYNINTPADLAAAERAHDLSTAE